MEKNQDKRWMAVCVLFLCYLFLAWYSPLDNFLQLKWDDTRFNLVQGNLMNRICLLIQYYLDDQSASFFMIYELTPCVLRLLLFSIPASGIIGVVKKKKEMVFGIAISTLAVNCISAILYGIYLMIDYCGELINGYYGVSFWATFLNMNFWVMLALSIAIIIIVAKMKPTNSARTTNNGEVKLTPTRPVSTMNAADELLKFRNLVDMGVITEEEFQEKKKQIWK